MRKLVSSLALILAGCSSFSPEDSSSQDLSTIFQSEASSPIVEDLAISPPVEDPFTISVAREIAKYDDAFKDLFIQAYSSDQTTVSHDLAIENLWQGTALLTTLDLEEQTPPGEYAFEHTLVIPRSSNPETQTTHFQGVDGNLWHLAKVLGGPFYADSQNESRSRAFWERARETSVFEPFEKASKEGLTDRIDIELGYLDQYYFLTRSTSDSVEEARTFLEQNEQHKALLSSDTHTGHQESLASLESRNEELKSLLAEAEQLFMIDFEKRHEQLFDDPRDHKKNPFSDLSYTQTRKAYRQLADLSKRADEYKTLGRDASQALSHIVYGYFDAREKDYDRRIEELDKKIAKNEEMRKQKELEREEKRKVLVPNDSDDPAESIGKSADRIVLSVESIVDSSEDMSESMQRMILSFERLELAVESLAYTVGKFSFRSTPSRYRFFSFNPEDGPYWSPISNYDAFMEGVFRSLYGPYYGPTEIGASGLRFQLTREDCYELLTLQGDNGPLLQRSVDKYLFGLDLVDEGWDPKEVSDRLRYLGSWTYHGETHNWSSSFFLLGKIPTLEME